MTHFGDYQNLIYGAGLFGCLPTWPVDYATRRARYADERPKLRAGRLRRRVYPSRSESFEHDWLSGGDWSNSEAGA